MMRGDPSFASITLVRGRDHPSPVTCVSGSDLPVGLLLMGFLLLLGGRHNGVSMRSVAARSLAGGGAREGDHPFCRALKSNRCPKSGDPPPRAKPLSRSREVRRRIEQRGYVALWRRAEGRTEPGASKPLSPCTGQNQWVVAACNAAARFARVTPAR